MDRLDLDGGEEQEAGRCGHRSRKLDTWCLVEEQFRERGRRGLVCVCVCVCKCDGRGVEKCESGGSSLDVRKRRMAGQARTRLEEREVKSV